MKKLSRLVLNELAKKELSDKAMSAIKGGQNACKCGCCYVDSGGSSHVDNGSANCTSNLEPMCPWSMAEQGYSLCGIDVFP